MTPPEAQGMGSKAEPTQALPAVLPCDTPAKKRSIPVIGKRADFLRAASARRQGMPGFLLQARDRQDGTATVRVGFTCSKKIGNAVARNRAKRRLRAVARAVLPGLAHDGWDYVLVGRPGATIARGFADLLGDLTAALAQIHRDRPPKAAPKDQTP